MFPALISIRRLANIELNACVVRVQCEDGYSMFTTTDISKTAEEIIMMYELRFFLYVSYLGIYFINCI